MVSAVVAIGGVSIMVQRQSLIDRLDAQVGVALDVAVRGIGGNDPPYSEGAAPPRPEELNQSDDDPDSGADPDPAQPTDPVTSSDLGPGPALGALSVVISHEEIVVAQVVDEQTGERLELDPDQVAVLREGAGTAAAPADVELGDLGSYRVAVRTEGSADETLTVIAGQSRSEVARTTRDLILIFSLVAAAAVSVTILAAWAMIRLGLRPLQDLVRVASTVSATPLATGAVELPARVPETDADPRTEVGQVGHALNTALDHVEESLRIRQETEEQLSRFVADASHELRTPLATIRGYAELLTRRTGAASVDVSRSLERIHSESVRMSAMVENLLLLARLDSGAELRREPVPLAGVLVDACADAQLLGPHHHWVLDLADHGADVTVDADPDRIQQVFVNLLTNARAHTPPGTTITVQLEIPDRDSVAVHVEDNGPGIPDALRARIFDRFVRGDVSRSRADGTTGLGMAIVEATVKAYGGTVDLTSEPGRTRVSVHLPRSEHL